MNELIKALATEAGCNPREMASGATRYMNAEGNLEKFAELLIRECARRAVQEAEYCELKMMPNSIIECNILEHFGVK